MSTQPHRPVRAFFGMDGQLSARYADLSRTAIVLLLLWAASVIVFGAFEVAQEAITFTGSDRSLNLLAVTGFVGVSALVLGLNILIAALVVGLVTIVRTGTRKLVRAVLYIAPALVGVLAIFGLSGFGVDTSGDNATETLAPPSQPNHLARGLAIWAVAVVVVVLSARVLRMGSEPPPRADDAEAASGERGFRRRVVAARLVAVAVGVAALVGWMHALNRPWVKVVNDSAESVEVQYCPGRVCGGHVHRLSPGQQHRIALGSAGRFVEDSVRITSGAKLLGCLPVLRVPDAPHHVEEAVSLADPNSC